MLRQVFATYSNRLGSWILLLVFFHVYIIFTIVAARLPDIPKNNFLLRNHLFNNNKDFFVSQEDAFKLFSPYVPQRGSISLILDAPYDLYSKDFSWLYAAQNHLAPLIVNARPHETHALFFCSSNSIAASRLQDTGYQLKELLAEGKGLAGKKA